MTRFRRPLYLVSLGLVWACSETSAPSTDSLTISPRLSSLILAGSAQFRANLFDQKGKAITGVTVAWRSSSPAVLSVSDSGLVRSLAPGTATISATAAGARDTLTIAVTSSFSQLSTAGLVTCGVATTGTAYCRGDDGYGQLGNLPAPDANTFVPVDVYGSVLSSLPFRAVYPSGSTTCALGADSSAWCWGDGTSGDLGVGRYEGSFGPPITQFYTPSFPVTGGHPFTQLAQGGGHTCALTGASTAYCWGANSFGATGDQLHITWSPRPILGIQFASLAAGGENSCGLTPAGAAYCWGQNVDGQLGVVTDTPFLTPVPVAAGPFQSLSVRQTTCGLDPDGTPYCWGGNAPYPRPEPVAGGLPFTQVSSSFVHGCGLTTDSSAYCWSTFTLTPDLIPSPVKFSSVAAGDDWDCGLGADSAAYCWPAGCPAGFFPYCGQQQPAAQVPGSLKFRSVSGEADYGVGCGQAVTDTLYCWGMNWPLGISPPRPPIASPQPVPGSSGLHAIRGGSPTCGLAADSTALCWTTYYNLAIDSLIVSGPQSVPGGLHYGSFDRFGTRWCGTVGGQVYCADSTNTIPTAVPGATGFSSVGTDGTTCGLKADGSAYCWGGNGHGELGIGFASSWSARPLPVGGGHQFVGLAVGTDHTCGVAADSSAWCWGGGQYVPDSLRFLPRLETGGLKLGGLVAGFDFTCGLTGVGAAYCWGRGLATPTAFQTALRFQSLSASQYYPYLGYVDVCGLTQAGDPICWSLPSTVPAPRRARSRR